MLEGDASIVVIARVDCSWATAMTVTRCWAAVAYNPRIDLDGIAARVPAHAMQQHPCAHPLTDKFVLLVTGEASRLCVNYREP